jgi:hypothetical protein
MFQVHHQNAATTPVIQMPNDEAGHWRWRKPPTTTFLHLAIPVLYGFMGTCYLTADMHIPILIASSYYSMALMHVFICYYDKLLNSP